MKYTDSEIRAALLKAADQIEQNPESYNFKTNDKPDGCGSPGCILGWVGAFLGIESDPEFPGAYASDVVDAVGFSWTDISETVAPAALHPSEKIHGIYTNSPISAAVMVREFADIRFPVKDVIPESVRRIFDVPVPDQTS